MSKFVRKIIDYFSIGGFLGPSYLWLVLVIYIPILIMLVFSFMVDVPSGTEMPGFTIGNYTHFFRELFYLRLTGKSLRMGLETTLFCLLFSYPLAFFLAKVVPKRWRMTLFMMIILPFWSNVLVRIFSWMVLLRSGGVLDILFRPLLHDSLNILFTWRAVIIGLIGSYLPYTVMTIYAAIDNIDNSLFEAASSLGCRPWQTFLRVILPLSLPGAFAGAILVFIPATGSFIEPRLLGGTAGFVLGTAIEDQFVTIFNWPFGAAMAFILLLIIIILMAIGVGLGRLLQRMVGASS